MSRVADWKMKRSWERLPGETLMQGRLQAPGVASTRRLSSKGRKEKILDPSEGRCDGTCKPGVPEHERAKGIRDVGPGREAVPPSTFLMSL